MPAEIDGRAETFYLLVDLTNKEIINSKLEKYLGNYISGSSISFEDKVSKTVFLIYNFEDIIELN